MKLRTTKTLAKRFLISKKRKLLKRYAGQDHFNARESGKLTRKKRRDVLIKGRLARNIKILLG